MSDRTGYLDALPVTGVCCICTSYMYLSLKILYHLPKNENLYIQVPGICLFFYVFDVDFHNRCAW